MSRTRAVGLVPIKMAITAMAHPTVFLIRAAAVGVAEAGAQAAEEEALIYRPPLRPRPTRRTLKNCSPWRRVGTPLVTARRPDRPAAQRHAHGP